MKRTTALVAATLSLTTSFAARPVLAQAEYKSADAQRVSQFKNALVAFEKARALLDKEDRDGALDSLGVCFSHVPEFPDGHFLMARIFYAEKEYTRALDEISKAEAGYERTTDLREKMKLDRQSVIRERIKGKDDAIVSQRARLATTPPEQRYKIENIIARLQGERDVLERELLMSSQSPLLIPPQYSFLHGNIHLRLEQNTEAVAQYEAALKVDPAYGDAANNLASLHHSAGQHAKALEVVTSATKQGAKINPLLKKSIEDAIGGRR